MEQIYRVEERTLLGGGRLPQLVREAGFLDIDVRIVKFEIGAWGPSHTPPHDFLTVDPTKHNIARVCASVWAQAMEANADRMEHYIPNLEERNDFSQDVKADVLNPNHHLYAKMYAILYCGC
jgi:hypothetical protein